MSRRGDRRPFDAQSLVSWAVHCWDARAVVATGLPATRWLATDLVCIADEPKSFADEVDRLLAQPRTPALLARRRAFAGEHSWARRADVIYAAIAGR